MYIKVRVITKAKKEIITEESPELFKISLKQKAERNMANDRILEIFRMKFRGQAVRIISGHHSPSKIIAVD